MQRKLLLGFGFLACSTYLIAIVIYHNASLLELSSVVAAQAAGVAALMYGYAQEYKHPLTNSKTEA